MAAKVQRLEDKALRTKPRLNNFLFFGFLLDTNTQMAAKFRRLEDEALRKKAEAEQQARRYADEQSRRMAVCVCVCIFVCMRVCVCVCVCVCVTS